MHAACKTVAYFKHNFLRSGQNFSMFQVIETATRAQKLCPARYSFRLRNKSAHFGDRVAPFVVALAFELRSSAIQGAAVLREVGSGQPRVVVAPKDLILVPINAHIQFTHAVHIASCGGIVAIDRVVGVGIQPAEYVYGLGAPEVFKQVFDLLFFCVSLGCNQVFTLYLAFEIESQAAINNQTTIIMVILHNGRQRTGAAVTRKSDIGKRHGKQVAPSNVDIECVLNRLCAASGKFNLKAMIAYGNQKLSGDVALLAHRKTLPVDLDAVPFSQLAPINTHQRTMNRNILFAQAAT